MAATLQEVLEARFWYNSIDHLLAANTLPKTRIDRGDFRWNDMRHSFVAGFHSSLPTLANAGNNLIVEHIVETQKWMDRLVALLNGQDVLFVGIYCPLGELERRELSRGNSRIGAARADLETTRHFCTAFLLSPPFAPRLNAHGDAKPSQVIPFLYQ